VNARYAYTLALAPSAISDCTTVAEAVSSAVLLGSDDGLTPMVAPVTTYARSPATVANVSTTLRALDAPPTETLKAPTALAVTSCPDTVATAGAELTNVTSGVTSALATGARPVPPNTAVARSTAVCHEHGVTR
jgi:hypothetical protein